MIVEVKLLHFKEPIHNTLIRLLSFGICDKEPFDAYGSKTKKAIVYFSVLFYLISDVPRCIHI